MGSIYKAGDKVLIKSKFDDNCNEFDYPCGFTDSMIRNYGGEIHTISCVYNIPNNVYEDRKMYEEPYFYSLKGNGYSWSSAMFEKEF